MTQIDWVRKTLLEHGEVTRNQALERYISRLGAIIFNLREEGLDIVGSWRKYDGGKDYVYTLRTRPTKTITRHRIENGVAVPYKETVEV